MHITELCVFDSRENAGDDSYEHVSAVINTLINIERWASKESAFVVSIVQLSTPVASAQ